MFGVAWLVGVVAAAFAHGVLGDTPESGDPVLGSVDVREFGAVGDGVTDDTDALSAAIEAAADPRRPVHVPPGTYTIKPGALPRIRASFVAPDAVFQAADTTDAALLTVQFDAGRPSTKSDPTAYLVEVGGLIGAQPMSGVGTGLWVKAAARCEFVVRQTNWLKYGVHVDTSWKTGEPMPIIFENNFWVKTDSGTVGLQITTNDDPLGVPIDANVFFMGSSFNHTLATVRISAGTTFGHNNVFTHTILEIGQPNSDCLVLTG